MADLLGSEELLALVTTVEAGSLARAARQLGIPRATLSRRLARLEQRLSVRLLRRSTRGLFLTLAGNTLLVKARVVLASLREAEASVTRDDQQLRGSLRVSVPSSEDAGLAEMLVAFAANNPELRMEVHASAEFVDLRAGAYDVVLRAGNNHGKDLVGRVLARDRLVAVASKSYLKKHGTPRSIEALAGHRCLAGYARGELPESYWSLRDGGRLRVEPVFSANSPTLLLRAAKQGLGIALVPMGLVQSEIEAGGLSPVLPNLVGADAQFMVLYLEREYMPPAVQAFVNHVVAWAQTEPLTFKGTRR